MKQIVVHTDGASRGNPGAAAIAYVIDGLPAGKIEFKKAIGIFSNNQAEYRALLAATEKLAELAVEDSEVNFLSDSELIIKQINGEYRVKDAKLRPLFDQVNDLRATLENRRNRLRFFTVRRHLNKMADRLANEALDG